MSLTKKALLDKLDQLFTKDMPFMKQFSARTEFFDEHRVLLRFAMDKGLVGNTMSYILHGGAIATMLDTVGGMLTMAAVFAKNPDESEEAQRARLAKTSTVNLLINYLRPGIDKSGGDFIAEARVVRCGSRITVCEMKLKDSESVLLASATGTYMNGT